jgi:hypothetical protein
MSVLISPKVIADQARDELIATDPLFTQIPVISADPGDLVTSINTALAGLGMGVLILPVTMKATKPDLAVPIPGTNLKGPFFDNVRLVIQVLEDPVLWRAATNPLWTGDNDASAVCMLVAAILHWFAPAGINERFTFGQVFWVTDPENLSSGLNVWHVEGKAGGGIGYNKGRVAPVTFQYDAVNEVVFVSCATPGASIWYCYLANPNQNNYPAPANPNATLAMMLNSGVLLNEDGTPMLNEDGSYQMNEGGASYAAIPLAPGQFLAARGWRSGLNPQNAPNDQQVFQAPT